MQWNWLPNWRLACHPESWRNFVRFYVSIWDFSKSFCILMRSDMCSDISGINWNWLKVEGRVCWRKPAREQVKITDCVTLVTGTGFKRDIFVRKKKRTLSIKSQTSDIYFIFLLLLKTIKCGLELEDLDLQTSKLGKNRVLFCFVLK